jgi:hypothetical protein
MNLLIDGKVILPPTEISCFRDVSLYSGTFANLSVLIETTEKDLIWEFLKYNSAHDFVSALVDPGEELGTVLSGTRGRCNICVNSINYDNLSFIITRLQSIRYLDRWNIDPALLSDM